MDSIGVKCVWCLFIVWKWSYWGDRWVVKFIWNIEYDLLDERIWLPISFRLRMDLYGLDGFREVKITFGNYVYYVNRDSEMDRSTHWDCWPRCCVCNSTWVQHEITINRKKEQQQQLKIIIWRMIKYERKQFETIRMDMSCVCMCVWLCRLNVYVFFDDWGLANCIALTLRRKGLKWMGGIDNITEWVKQASYANTFYIYELCA